MRLDRRRFLACTGAIVSARVPWSLAGGGEEEKPLVEFAAVADTHLGRGGEGPEKLLADAVEEINASPAEFTLFLGDLVDNGAKDEAQYPKWLEAAKGLKKPFYPIPGNHDPAELFKKYIRAETDYAFDHKGFRFLLFNDSETTSHDGIVAPEQLKWLAAQVDDAAGKKLRVVLCAHIPAHPNKHPDTGWYVRKGGKELETLLMFKGGDTIVAFLSGHFHCGMRGWSDRGGVHELVLPALAWNGDRRLATAPGFSGKEHRRGYTQAEVHRKDLQLSYKPLGAHAVGPLVLGLGEGT